MDLNLERIIRFCVVAEEMSFTKASRRLQVDQPWLSRQVQQLEAQLGFALFERTTRRIALTPEGEKFLAVAKELTEVADRTRSVARSLSQDRRQALRLGLSRATFWVPERAELIDTFRTRYPQTTVEMVSGLSPRILQALERRKIDAGIIAITEGLEKFDYVPLHRSRPALMVPQEHPLAVKAEIYMKDLEGIELVTPMREGNPFAFDLEYEPFFRAGVRRRSIPEGRPAVYHYATSERLFMLGYEAEKVGSGLVRRTIIDCDALIEVGAIRNRGDDRQVLRKFWSAVAIVAEAAGIK